jgi:hypothetical protein
MPIKRGSNPCEPPRARTAAANAARWLGHTPPTPEELQARKIEYARRAREKYLLKRDAEPSANGQTEDVCEVKADESLDVPEKPVIRRGKPKADRSNSHLGRSIEQDRRTAETVERRETIRKLEMK